MSTPFIARLVRVARFDTGIYTEVAPDPAATWQAITVVVAVALAHAVEGVFLATQGGWNVLRSIIPGFQVEIVFWLIWAAGMYLIGTRLLRSGVRYGAVARTLGFAALPGILYAFGFVSEIILVISWSWRIATSFVAMRQVFGWGWAKSLVVVAVGGVVAFVIAGYGTLATLQVLDWAGVG